MSEKLQVGGGVSPPKPNIVQEVLVAITVSFVAISLGAAFGILSQRGALAGILSAGVIAFITSLLGGTRIQCSGPTAPMTTVTAAIMAAAAGTLLDGQGGADREQFVNMVFILAGAILVLAAILRLGRFVELVPKVVISGFMNGIAILIWVDQGKRIFGLGGKEMFSGGFAANMGVIIATVALIFLIPRLLGGAAPWLKAFLPSTLVSIVVMTGAVLVLGMDIERVSLGGSLGSFADVEALLDRHVPRSWDMDLVMLALPFAGQLAMLAYLDTLLTSLVIDKKWQAMSGTNESTAQNKELVAQGLANGVVALFGGIPGAQATIRSVLILNEGARSRIAGTLVGVFVIVEMLLLQDAISLIPQAVFAGVLLKVGYDVFDWEPVKIYAHELAGGMPKEHITPETPLVTHLDMVFIAGTTLLTVLVNLNVAVVAFSVLFYALRLVRPIHDLRPYLETEGFADEA